MKFLLFDSNFVLTKYSVELSRAAGTEFDAEYHQSTYCTIRFSGVATVSFVGVSIT
jgi:hypothetical protein